jgi:hypothetical protein
MSRPRFFAPRIAIPVATVLVGLAGGSFLLPNPAAAVSPAEGGWKPAENRPVQQASHDQWNAAPKRVFAMSSQPSQAAANTAKPVAASTPKEVSPWRLPTNKLAPGLAGVNQHSGAKHLQHQAAASSHREPREFKPPTSVMPLRSANQNQRGASSTSQVARPAPAISQAAAVNQNAQPPGNARSSPPPATGRTGARQASPSHRRSPRKSSPSLWDTITVAFEGAEQLTAGPDDLPLPRQSEKSLVDSHGEYSEEIPAPHDPNGYYLPGEEAADPCCGDACCGDGGCEPGCGCGGECSCEPGCGRANGSCGSEDLFCIGSEDSESCHSVRIRVPKWQEFTVFGGVHGFKGPYDQARDSGNFGFHEGFNIGFKVPNTTAGYQIGYQAVHSQLNGDTDTNIADPHTQQFFTAGFYQRAKDGVQFGIAWDMLRDERFGAVDFHQLRGELSMIERGCHEIGLAAAMHLNDLEVFPADEDDPTVLFQPSDQYLLFYRLHGPRGGEGRVYGGFNDDDDGIIGADMMVPLSDRWSLATGFTYLIPAEHAGQEGASQEAWNISTALVWHWDCRARRSHSSCYRPLFNVADNGYLIIDERLGAAGD